VALPGGLAVAVQRGSDDAQDGDDEQNSQGYIRADEGRSEGRSQEGEDRRGGVGQRGDDDALQPREVRVAVLRPLVPRGLRRPGQAEEAFQYPSPPGPPHEDRPGGQGSDDQGALA